MKHSTFTRMKQSGLMLAALVFISLVSVSRAGAQHHHGGTWQGHHDSIPSFPHDSISNSGGGQGGWDSVFVGGHHHGGGFGWLDSSQITNWIDSLPNFIDTTHNGGGNSGHDSIPNNNGGGPNDTTGTGWNDTIPNNGGGGNWHDSIPGGNDSTGTGWQDSIPGNGGGWHDSIPGNGGTIDSLPQGYNDSIPNWGYNDSIPQDTTGGGGGGCGNGGHRNLSFGTSTTAVSTSIGIYPNPFMQSATISLAGTQNTVTFRMFDGNGRVVMQITNLTNGTYSFDRGELTSGIYIYQVIDGSSIAHTGKIVIQ